MSALLETAIGERRDYESNGRELGHVIACTGAKICISCTVDENNIAHSESWSVGRLVTIPVGQSRVIGMVASLDMNGSSWKKDAPNEIQITAELVGEIRKEGDRIIFTSGIAQYPYVGALAHDIRAEDLQLIYEAKSDNSVTIGQLSQNRDMDASICITSMLSRHFALLGTTGVGKSSALSLLVRKSIEHEPKLRVVVLDIHDEYASAFGPKSIALTPDELDLPFWLFKLDEFAEVLFRGQPKTLEEVNILRDLVGQAKSQFNNGQASKSVIARKQDAQTFTADSPVPYRIADLLALLDERVGRLEGKQEKPILLQLKSRIQSAMQNPRFGFMFSANTITDTIVENISSIFRVEDHTRPITALQLAGIPSDVVDSVVSVLFRLAFDIALWSEGAIKILVVCEEAHRYISADENQGFLPTRQAVARIAKEGRKYGVSVGIVTQRPGELDPTILSQCSTVFAMRLANDRDQDIIRSALPNSSKSTTSFLASIANGEAIAFGEAVSIPMRMMFERIPSNELPAANRSQETTMALNLKSVVEKMRSSESSKRKNSDEIAEMRANISYKSALRAEQERAASGKDTKKLDKFRQQAAQVAEPSVAKEHESSVKVEQERLRQEMMELRSRLTRK